MTVRYPQQLSGQVWVSFIVLQNFSMNHNKIAAKTADVKSIIIKLFKRSAHIWPYPYIIAWTKAGTSVHVHRETLHWLSSIYIGQPKKTLKALFVFQCCKRGSKRDYVGDKNI